MAARPAVAFVLLVTNGLLVKLVDFGGVDPNLKSEKLTLLVARNVCD